MAKKTEARLLVITPDVFTTGGESFWNRAYTWTPAPDITVLELALALPLLLWPINDENGDPDHVYERLPVTVKRHFVVHETLSMPGELAAQRKHAAEAHKRKVNDG